MRLPRKENDHDEYYKELIQQAQKIAARLTLQTGTAVKAAILPMAPEGGWAAYDWMDPMRPELDYELVFIALDQRFRNLKEVKKALKLKAFL